MFIESGEFITRLVMSHQLIVKLPRARLESMCDASAKQMVYSLSTEFHKRRFEASMEIVKVPATWWDAVKERWLPDRIARVRYREIPTRYELWAVCHHLPSEIDSVHLAFLADKAMSKETA